jgi:hypothetical protein
VTTMPRCHPHTHCEYSPLADRASLLSAEQPIHGPRGCQRPNMDVLRTC